MQILGFLLKRFSEPSSYAGLGAILALIGLQLSDSDLGQLAQLLAAGCGLAALLLKERGMLPALALCIAAAATLAACAPPMRAGASGALGGGLSTASQIADTTIKTACAQYKKAESAAGIVVASGALPAPLIKKVQIIEEYGDAACAAPPPGDVLSTAVWLGELIGQIRGLTATPPSTPAT